MDKKRKNRSIKARKYAAGMLRANNFERMERTARNECFVKYLQAKSFRPSRFAREEINEIQRRKPVAYSRDTMNDLCVRQCCLRSGYSIISIFKYILKYSI